MTTKKPPVDDNVFQLWRKCLDFDSTISPTETRQIILMMVTFRTKCENLSLWLFFFLAFIYAALLMVTQLPSFLNDDECDELDIPYYCHFLFTLYTCSTVVALEVWQTKLHLECKQRSETCNNKYRKLRSMLLQVPQLLKWRSKWLQLFGVDLENKLCLSCGLFKLFEGVIIIKENIGLLLNKMNNSVGIKMIVLAFSWIELRSHNYVEKQDLINSNN